MISLEMSNYHIDTFSPRINYKSYNCCYVSPQEAGEHHPHDFDKHLQGFSPGIP